MNDIVTRVNTITDALKRNAYVILQWTWGVVILTIMTMGLLTIVLSNPKQATTQQAVAVVSEIPEPTTDTMLDSMVRAWTDKANRFKKVCYDAPGAKPELHGFFIFYGPKASEDDKTLDEGWWYVEQQFFRTSAGKIYTNDVEGLPSSQHVYPDVTGLSCKDR